jgi:hypothetical protein
MQNTLSIFLQKLHNHPEEIEFTETMMIIEQYYYFKDTAFENGQLTNKHRYLHKYFKVKTP